jgi:alkylation response protein AidB-like acyl-CoA dehydrogenase
VVPTNGDREQPEGGHVDLTFTEEQDLLRATVRDLCQKHSSPEIVRQLEGDPMGYRPELWTELAATGLLGLTIPDAEGGAGLTALELVVAYEEFGRALCWSPHFTSGVIGASVIGQGSDEQRAEWLPRIASGQVVLTAAWLEPERGCGPEGVQTAAEWDGDGFRVTGTKMLVPFASSATHLLTLVRTGAGERDIDLLLIEAGSAGIRVEPLTAMAHDAEAFVHCDGVRVPAGARLGDEGEGWRIWEEAATDGLIALAGYAVGGAARAHELSVEYAKEREQFGRAIGSFQGLAHPLAEMAVEVEGARTLAYEAAWARAMGRSASTLAAMAKLYAADVYRRATKLGHQVFGGIGFTTDIDMQLYFRRAKQLELTWWDPKYLEQRVAAAELDAETPFVSIEAGS